MSSSSFEFYKAFFFVAKYGTLSRAAAELYITQPSLTKSIHNLENQLGCPLFTRTVKGMTLTVEGQLLYDRISPACEAILNAEREIDSLRRLKTGTVRINTNNLLTKTVLIPAIEDFRRQHEDVVFELHTESFTQTRRGLASGRLDLGLDYEDRPYQDQMAIHRDGQSIKLWAGEAYYDIPVAGRAWSSYLGKRLSTEEIAAFPLILRPQLENSQIDFYKAIFRPEGVSVRDIYASGIETRIALVLNGLGVSFMPHQCAEPYLSTGEMVQLDYEGYLPARRMVAFTDAQRGMSMAAREFLNLLIKREQMIEGATLE